MHVAAIDRIGLPVDMNSVIANSLDLFRLPGMQSGDMFRRLLLISAQRHRWPRSGWSELRNADLLLLWLVVFRVASIGGPCRPHLAMTASRRSRHHVISASAVRHVHGLHPVLTVV